MEKKGNGTEGFRDILSQVSSHSLHISRLPTKTKEKFVSLANEEFAGDYGMTLKFLLDGLVDTNTQEMFALLQEIQERIQFLEEKVNSLEQDTSDDENTIKTLSGRKINKK